MFTDTTIIIGDVSTAVHRVDIYVITAAAAEYVPYI